MITEGIGKNAPQPVPVVMTNDELRCIYTIACQRAEHRAYKSRGDAWGQGIKSGMELPGVGTLDSATRPIYVGTCGEYAVQRYVDGRFPLGHGCKVDSSLTVQGDFGIDLTAYGCKMQVKTRQDSGGLTLFKRANGEGRRLSVPSHACVFCEWTAEPLSTTYLLGWQWSSWIVDRPLVRSQRGDWFNAEIHDADLLPMSRLRDILDAWRLAG